MLQETKRRVTDKHIQTENYQFFFRKRGETKVEGKSLKWWVADYWGSIRHKYRACKAGGDEIEYIIVKVTTGTSMHGQGKSYYQGTLEIKSIMTKKL